MINAVLGTASEAGFPPRSLWVLTMKSLIAAMSVCALAVVATPAFAAPTTFATVADISQDFFWTVNNGVGTLNTNSNQGATVNFAYQNVNVPGWLSGTLSATMLINGGNGIQTTSAAINGGSITLQSLNQPFTISFTLKNGAVGARNLLTVTIGPNSGTNPTMVGSGAAVSLTSSSASVVETFSSDFLRFANGTIYSSVIGFNSVSPSVSIGPSGLMSNFVASALLANFSADPVPTVIPEPGSLAALIGGLMVLGIAARRRATV